MRAIASALSAIFLFTLLPVEASARTTFKTFTSAAYNLAIKYPADWTVQESTDENTVGGFVSPKEDAGIVIGVVRFDGEFPLTLEAFADSGMEGLGTDVQAVGRRKGRVARVPSLTVSIAGEDSEGKLMKGEVVFFIKNETGYFLFFGSEKKTFGKNRGVFQKMLRSIKILG